MHYLASVPWEFFHRREKPRRCGRHERHSESIDRQIRWTKMVHLDMCFFIMPQGWYEQTRARRICMPKSLHWEYGCLAQYFPGKRFSPWIAVRRKSTAHIYRNSAPHLFRAPIRFFRNFAEKCENDITAFSANYADPFYGPFSKIRPPAGRERMLKTTASRIDADFHGTTFTSSAATIRWACI